MGENRFSTPFKKELREGKLKYFSMTPNLMIYHWKGKVQKIMTHKKGFY